MSYGERAIGAACSYFNQIKLRGDEARIVAVELGDSTTVTRFETSHGQADGPHPLLQEDADVV